jgi:hypothetical protein
VLLDLLDGHMFHPSFLVSAEVTLLHAEAFKDVFHGDGAAVEKTPEYYVTNLLRRAAWPLKRGSLELQRLVAPQALTAAKLTADIVSNRLPSHDITELRHAIEVHDAAAARIAADAASATALVRNTAGRLRSRLSMAEVAGTLAPASQVTDVVKDAKQALLLAMTKEGSSVDVDALQDLHSAASAVANWADEKVPKDLLDELTRALARAIWNILVAGGDVARLAPELGMSPDELYGVMYGEDELPDVTDYDGDVYMYDGSRIATLEEKRALKTMERSYNDFVSGSTEPPGRLPTPIKIDLSKIVGIVGHQTGSDAVATAAAWIKDRREKIKTAVFKRRPQSDGTDKPSVAQERYTKSDYSPCHLGVSLMCVKGRRGQSEEDRLLACDLLEWIRPILEAMRIWDSVIDMNVLGYWAGCSLFGHYDNHYKSGETVTFILEILGPSTEGMPILVIKDRRGNVLRAERGENLEHMMNAFHWNSRQNSWFQHYVVPKDPTERARIKDIMRDYDGRDDELRISVVIFTSHRLPEKDYLDPKVEDWYRRVHLGNPASPHYDPATAIVDSSDPSAPPKLNAAKVNDFVATMWLNVKLLYGEPVYADQRAKPPKETGYSHLQKAAEGVVGYGDRRRCGIVPPAFVGDQHDNRVVPGRKGFSLPPTEFARILCSPFQLEKLAGEEAEYIALGSALVTKVIQVSPLKYLDWDLRERMARRQENANQDPSEFCGSGYKRSGKIKGAKKPRQRAVFLLTHATDTSWAGSDERMETYRHDPCMAAFLERLSTHPVPVWHPPTLPVYTQSHVAVRTLRGLEVRSCWTAGEEIPHMMDETTADGRRNLCSVEYHSCGVGPSALRPLVITLGSVVDGKLTVDISDQQDDHSFDELVSDEERRRPSAKTEVKTISEVVRLQPYGVLGTQLGKAKPKAPPPIAGLTTPTAGQAAAFLDPAGLRYIRPPGRPSGAGGASGGIYHFLGISDAFPADVTAAITRTGHAKHHVYRLLPKFPREAVAHVIHVVGPDFTPGSPDFNHIVSIAAPDRSVPAFLAAAVEILKIPYRAALAEFRESGLSVLRLLPISGGIYARSNMWTRKRVPELTRRALDAGFADLPEATQQWLLSDQVTLDLCIFDETELAEFESAGFLSEAEHRARAEVTRAFFTPSDPVSSPEPAAEAPPSPSLAQPAAEPMEEDDDAASPSLAQPAAEPMEEDDDAADDDDGPMVKVNGQEKGYYLVTEEDQGFMSTDELVRLREVHDQLVG